MVPDYFSEVVLVLGDLATCASGPNVVVQRLATWLVDHGYRVTVVGTWKGTKPSIEKLGCLYGHARIILHRRYFKDTWHFAPGVVRFALHLLGSSKRYVIDVHSVWLFNGFVLSLIAKLKGWRYFVSFHGNLRPVAFSKNRTMKVLALALFVKWWLHRAAGLIALNEPERLEAIQLLKGTPISVIGNGVPLNPSALSSTRLKQALFLGRIDPIKNLESLIDAFIRVSDEFPDWELCIVGPASNQPYREQLASYCATSQHGDKISFYPAAYGEEKESWFLSASLFVLASRSEGQPFAALEALAHGVPVLLSDQCNIDIPRSCGRICGCSVEEITQALREMLSLTEDQARTMRSEALRFVQQEFSEPASFGKRLSLYVDGHDSNGRK